MTAWAERLADRSPTVQRSRDRSVQQARVLVEAARRVLAEKGESFTTHELAKEAGVALQTFYRYFAGKDELLLAVLEDMVAEAAEQYSAQADPAATPVGRLRSHVHAVADALQGLDDPQRRFVASEHWRLSRLFPAEVAQAVAPFVTLVEGEIRAAVDAGLLRSEQPARYVWLVNQLLLSVFHQRAFAGVADPTLGADLWRFTLRALGGTEE